MGPSTKAVAEPEFLDLGEREAIFQIMHHIILRDFVLKVKLFLLPTAGFVVALGRS